MQLQLGPVYDPLINNIIIGNYNLLDDISMVIKITDAYYDWVMDILQTTQEELKHKDELVSLSFKINVIDKIKAQFFPRYRDFEKIFQKGYLYENKNLSHLSYWPTNDEQQKRLQQNYKFSDEFYINLVKSNATPPKLKRALNKKIPVLLTQQDMRNHTFIVSRTDTGKSTLILELTKNIIDSKEGNLILMEPHGDLSIDLARLCKNSDDLIFIDPFLSSNHSVTVNIFDMQTISQKSISKYSALVLNTFKQIIGSEFSVTMHSLLNPVIAVLLQIPNTSFFDLLRFLNDDENHDLLEYAKNHALIPSHRLFFQKQFSQSRYSITKFSIISKLNVLLQDSIFSNMLTGRSTINLQEAMNTPGKIIIIRLNTIKMIETIEPIGRFLVALFVSYAFQRENIPIHKRVDTHLMIDEASMFLGDSIELILAQARKFHLYLLMAVQNNAQLPTSIEASILSNTAIKFVGMNSHKNHSIMSKEIGASMEQLFSLQKRGEFFIKVGNQQPRKFRVSDRVLHKEHYTSQELLAQMMQKQLKQYYRDINTEDIDYVDVPYMDLEKEKPYSKDATRQLLEDVSNSDNEFLDY